MSYKRFTIEDYEKFVSEGYEYLVLEEFFDNEVIAPNSVENVLVKPAKEIDHNNPPWEYYSIPDPEALAFAMGDEHFTAWIKK